MKKFVLREHNKKMLAFSKKAASGTYPSKRVAEVGSIMGSVIGIILILVDIVSSFSGCIWGMGSLVGGIVTVISNMINLKLIK